MASGPEALKRLDGHDAQSDLRWRLVDGDGTPIATAAAGRPRRRWQAPPNRSLLAGVCGMLLGS